MSREQKETKARLDEMIDAHPALDEESRNGVAYIIALDLLAKLAEPDRGPWFILEGGSSEDGMGPGIFQSRTKDPEVALAHLLKCRKDPYSTGGVWVITENGRSKPYDKQAFEAAIAGAAPWRKA